MTKTFGALESVSTDDGLGGIHPAAPFQQGHLGRQVVSLDHFDRLITTPEADVFRAPICAGAM